MWILHVSGQTFWLSLARPSYKLGRADTAVPAAGVPDIPLDCAETLTFVPVPPTDGAHSKLEIFMEPSKPDSTRKLLAKLSQNSCSSFSTKLTAISGGVEGVLSITVELFELAFSTSALEPAALQIIKSNAAQLDYTVLDTFQPGRTTHLLMNKYVMTMKAIQSLQLGLSIVTKSYVQEITDFFSFSKSKNSHLAPFALPDPLAHKPAIDGAIRKAIASYPTVDLNSIFAPCQMRKEMFAGQTFYILQDRAQLLRVEAILVTSGGICKFISSFMEYHHDGYILENSHVRNIQPAIEKRLLLSEGDLGVSVIAAQWTPFYVKNPRPSSPVIVITDDDWDSQPLKQSSPPKVLAAASSPAKQPVKVESAVKEPAQVKAKRTVSSEVEEASPIKRAKLTVAEEPPKYEAEPVTTAVATAQALPPRHERIETTTDVPQPEEGYTYSTKGGLKYPRKKKINRPPEKYSHTKVIPNLALDPALCSPKPFVKVWYNGMGELPEIVPLVPCKSSFRSGAMDTSLEAGPVRAVNKHKPKKLATRPSTSSTTAAIIDLSSDTRPVPLAERTSRHDDHGNLGDVSKPTAAPKPKQATLQTKLTFAKQEEQPPPQPNSWRKRGIENWL